MAPLRARQTPGAGLAAWAAAAAHKAAQAQAVRTVNRWGGGSGMASPRQHGGSDESPFTTGSISLRFSRAASPATVIAWEGIQSGTCGDGIKYSDARSKTRVLHFGLEAAM